MSWDWVFNTKSHLYNEIHDVFAKCLRINKQNLDKCDEEWMPLSVEVPCKNWKLRLKNLTVYLKIYILLSYLIPNCAKIPIVSLSKRM